MVLVCRTNFLDPGNPKIIGVLRPALSLLSLLVLPRNRCFIGNTDVIPVDVFGSMYYDVSVSYAEVLPSSAFSQYSRHGKTFRHSQTKLL